MFKKSIILSIISFHCYSAPSLSIKGKVKSSDGCVQPSQLFVSQKSKEREKLLYQVEVPVNGTFSVNLTPGKYQIHAANKEGCQATLNLEGKESNAKVTLNLSRKKEQEKR